MKLITSLLVAVSVVGCASPDEGPTGEATGRANAEPPQLGAMLTREAALEPQLEPQDGEPPAHGHGHDGGGDVGNAGGKGGRGGGSADMTFHGGAILLTAVVQPIFWGSSWAKYSGDKMTGIDSFYAGFGGSDYAKASDEYTGTNGQIGPTVSSHAHVVDTSAASGGGSTSAILAEVCKMIPSPDPSGNGYYPVYTDLPRNGADYCAYHSYGTCKGIPVQFGFFWDLDGDTPCGPDDTSGLHSAGLAALANAGGHELSEARTDPTFGAWYDASGNESADKCAWTYGAPLVTLSNGSQWKLQGLWSNAAYNAGKGYANSSGQKGCLSGL